ncbi:hypothetical protein EE612_057394, partial [Oryza sativa]
QVFPFGSVPLKNLSS